MLENSIPLLIAVAAMANTSWGPVEWFNLCRAPPVPIDAGGIRIGASPPKAAPVEDKAAIEHCRSMVRLELIVAAILLKIIIDLVNLQFPLWRLKDFRKIYLDSTIRTRWDELKVRYPTLRINIMVARRRFWLLGFRSFDFEYPLGFSAPDNHHDMKLHLLCFQGVAGKAYRTEEPQVEYFPPGGPAPPSWWRSPKQWWKNSWRLFPPQIKKTRNVRLIISVPMLEEAKPGEAEKAKVRGVINIDVTGKQAAPEMTPVQTAEIIDYFLKTGKVASHLW